MAFDLDDDELKATRELFFGKEDEEENIIEKGEYVRLQNGIIAKCEKIEDDGFYYFDNIVRNEGYEKFNYINKIYLKSILIKHGINLIDVLEAGDIVETTHQKILRIREVKNGNWYADTGYKHIENEIIKVLSAENFRYDCYYTK